jgi:hypothetical protein
MRHTYGTCIVREIVLTSLADVHVSIWDVRSYHIWPGSFIPLDSFPFRWVRIYVLIQTAGRTKGQDTLFYCSAIRVAACRARKVVSATRHGDNTNEAKLRTVWSNLNTTCQRASGAARP